MFVSDLAVDWFRSYRQLVINLEPGVNVFLGANGQGKTNLLEALNYLAVLSSHRIGADSALIFRGAPGENPRAGIIRVRVQPGKNAANLGGATHEKTESQAPSELLEIEIIAGRANRAMINRHKVRPRELVGHLSTVLFAPEDLLLINGDPGERRDFMDKIALELQPALAGTFTDLQKTLRQRGAYLREVARRHESPDEIQLGIWDEALVPLFAQVMRAREAICQELEQRLPRIYAQISGGEQASVGLKYCDSVSKILGADTDMRTGFFQDNTQLETQILAALRARHQDEARRGVNLTGTHRDEIALSLHEFPVKGYASHGECWSFALALRLAEFYLLRDRLGEAPVLLLDDVFSELDQLRREAVLGAIEAADQVWVTSALGTELPAGLEAKFFQVALNSARESQVEAGVEPMVRLGGNS